MIDEKPQSAAPENKITEILPLKAAANEALFRAAQAHNAKIMTDTQEAQVVKPLNKKPELPIIAPVVAAEVKEPPNVKPDIQVVATQKPIKKQVQGPEVMPIKPPQPPPSPSPIIIPKPTIIEQTQPRAEIVLAETILPETDIAPNLADDQLIQEQVVRVYEPSDLVELPMFEDYDTNKPESSLSSQPEPTPLFSQELAEQIEVLEPLAAQEATGILAVVQEKIEQLQELVNVTGDTEDLDILILEQELEVLCTRLLVCMGQEPTAEAVTQLINSLKVELQEQMIIARPEADIDGMHEKKWGLFKLLTNLVKVDLAQPFNNILGKYALQLAVS